MHKKMKFSIKDFFSKWDQIRRKLRIWSHLLKKLLMETSFFVQCKNAFYLSYSLMFYNFLLLLKFQFTGVNASYFEKVKLKKVLAFLLYSLKHT